MAEQLRSTLLLISPHGAQFANVPFMHAGAGVIELMPPDFESQMYQHLCTFSGLRYEKVAAGRSYPKHSLTAWPLGSFRKPFSANMPSVVEATRHMLDSLPDYDMATSSALSMQFLPRSFAQNDTHQIAVEILKESSSIGQNTSASALAEISDTAADQSSDSSAAARGPPPGSTPEPNWQVSRISVLEAEVASLKSQIGVDRQRNTHLIQRFNAMNERLKHLEEVSGNTPAARPQPRAASRPAYTFTPRGMQASSVRSLPARAPLAQGTRFHQEVASLYTSQRNDGYHRSKVP
uniref:Uncharacterized protein n=1 Tax=Haptolina ericina TaxID=156174 RepID=A0A7S3EYQ9_9EUKA